MPALPGVSVVLPVHNGVRWLEDVITAIEAQAHGGPLEILAIDDSSTDRSRDVLERLAAAGRLKLLDSPRRGAPAALNAGIRAARYPLIAQIDQDVVIHPGWLAVLTAAMANPSVGAAQGQYVASAAAGLWSRVMALDLRQRYVALPGSQVNHVCTGNSVYRKAALLDIGLFDERLGYGYDNDVSYRLTMFGYVLSYCEEATSVHHWREGAKDYFRQQYGFGYGRLDLVSKHRRRFTGDDVSPLGMMAHAPAACAGWALLVFSGLLWPFATSARWLFVLGVAILATLALERTIAGVRAARRFRDRAGWWFGPVHLVRDTAWAAAIGAWTLRRLLGRPQQPAESMSPRGVSAATSHDGTNPR